MLTVIALTISASTVVSVCMFFQNLLEEVDMTFKGVILNIKNYFN